MSPRCAVYHGGDVVVDDEPVETYFLWRPSRLDHAHVALAYSAVQKGWPLMHDEPSALSNQLFGCQLLKAEC